MTDTDAGDDAEDLAVLARSAAALADAVEAALPRWVERVVAQRWSEWSQEPLPASVRRAAVDAGTRARDEVAPTLRSVLAADVDAQRVNPLALIRRAAVHPAAVLAAAGVPPVLRDEQAERLFPDDRYDLGPASFAELDPSVHEPGLVWGAAKAHVILRRRRRPSG
jgi:hypothetical protein